MCGGDCNTSSPVGSSGPGRRTGLFTMMVPTPDPFRGVSREPRRRVIRTGRAHPRSVRPLGARPCRPDRPPAPYQPPAGRAAGRRPGCRVRAGPPPPGPVANQQGPRPQPIAGPLASGFGAAAGSVPRPPGASGADHRWGRRAEAVGRRRHRGGAGPGGDGGPAGPASTFSGRPGQGPGPGAAGLSPRPRPDPTPTAPTQPHSTPTTQPNPNNPTQPNNPTRPNNPTQPRPAPGGNRGDDGSVRRGNVRPCRRGQVR